MDWTQPNVCVDENMSVTGTPNTPSVDRVLQMSKWSLPQLVRDVKVLSSGDGKLSPVVVLPGKLLMEQKISWKNESPLDVSLRIRVTRHWREWVTSNPNAIQFRDRWTRAIDGPAELPTTAAIFNGQCGGAIDRGSNSVAEPNPGLFYAWSPTVSSEEWVPVVGPGQSFELWYRAYVWTPPPWSDNGNKNSPKHTASAFWSRIQLETRPTQGTLVAG